MLPLSKSAAAETAIRRNLVNRLEDEGHVSPMDAARLRAGDLDAVLDEVFKHCRRVLLPFADGTLVLEPKEAVQ